MKWRLIVALWALVAAVWIAWHHGETVPQEIPDAPVTSATEAPKLPCVSYSPYYRPGATPLKETMFVPRAWIEEDLRALSAVTRCVRTYSVDQGLDAVPDVARELGMTVWLGAWIGREDDKNQRELDKALALAAQYPGTVSRLIVGNEVMLRREQTPEGMARWLAYAKARSPVPVTYADVWEFWLRHREALQPHVDLVTLHILPYWEDQPQPIEEAALHLFRIRAMARQVFGHAPIAIGETGWPSAGKQREGAVPSLVNQAKYVRAVLALADSFGWDVNVIESHDQPWKRRLEGTVGGFWGVLDVQGQPKFTLAGPVAERAAFWPVLVYAAVGALLFAWPRGRHPEALPRWARALFGALVGLTLMWQLEHAQVAYRDLWEAALLGLTGLIATLVAAAWVLVPPWRHSPPRWLSQATAYVIFALAVANVWLLVDGRYRDYATCLYVAFALAAPLRTAPAGFAERLWATIAMLSALYLWFKEPMNAQALLWLGATLLVVLTLPRGKAKAAAPR